MASNTNQKGQAMRRNSSLVNPTAAALATAIPAEISSVYISTDALWTAIAIGFISLAFMFIALLMFAHYSPADAKEPTPTHAQ